MPFGIINDAKRNRQWETALLPKNAITAAQCRAARGFLSWTQEQLALAAEVNEATVRGFERGTKSPQRASLAAIRRALEAAGVEFLDARGVLLTQQKEVMTNILDLPETPNETVKRIEGAC